MKLCLLQFVLLMNWIVTLRRITCLTLDLVCIYFSVWGFPWLISGWWFGTWIWFFPYIGNFIIPTDELTPSFFRGVGWNHQFHVFCGKIPREVFCQWFLWAEFRTGSPGSPEMSWATLVPIDPITMFFLGGFIGRILLRKWSHYGRLNELMWRNVIAWQIFKSIEIMCISPLIWRFLQRGRAQQSKRTGRTFILT